MNAIRESSIAKTNIYRVLKNKSIIIITSFSGQYLLCILVSSKVSSRRNLVLTYPNNAEIICLGNVESSLFFSMYSQ